MTKTSKEFDYCMDVIENGDEEEVNILLLALLKEKSKRVDKGELKND